MSQVVNELQITNLIGRRVGVYALAVKTEEEMDCILCKIFLELVTLYTLELKTDTSFGGVGASGVLFQMFDKNGSSKPVSRCEGVRDVSRNTKFLVVRKPDHVEVASTSPEVLEKILHCKYCMQKLEAI